MTKKYICNRCRTEFLDKSKYNRHINRKYPCKNKNDTKKIECALCNKVVIGDENFIEHLKNNCINSKTVIVKYGYKTKFFGKKVFPESKKSGNIVILNKDDNYVISLTKNLYSFFKKNENLKDYDLLYYYPIKDIDKFKENSNIELNKDIKIESNKLILKIKKIVKEINGLCNKELYKPTKKNLVKYNCALCNQDVKTVNLLRSHLSIFHKNDGNSSDEENFMVKGSFINELKNKKLQKEVIDMIKKKDCVCQFCNKEYSNKYNLMRHQNTCNEKTMVEDVNILKEQNNELKKEMYETHKLLNKMLKKDKNQIINNTTNILQNNIQININDYGKEDISHISLDFVKGLISQMDAISLVKYIEAVHFKNPTNSNIFIPSIKDNYVLLKNGNKWSMDDKNKVIDGMIVTNFDRINDVYEKINKNLPNPVKENFENYTVNFDGTKDERLNLKEKTQEMIITRQKEKIAISDGKNDVIEI